MFKIVRFPSALENFFRSLKTEFLYGHFEYFRILVLLIALSKDDKNISSLYKYLDDKQFPHRTRYNNFVNVLRWKPQEVLAKKAYELLTSLKLQKEETIYLILDDSKKTKRGKKMEALGWVHDPVSGKTVWGHQFVKAVIYARGMIIPFAISLYVKHKDCQKYKVPFRKVTELASDIIKSFIAPDGINVQVLFDCYYLCPTVTKTCQEKGFHYISVLKSNRNLKNRGRKLKAGSYGDHCFKTKGRMKMKIPKKNGTATYTYVDADWLDVSRLCQLHIIYSRKNSERKILCLATDHPKLKATAIIRAYDIRWNIEVFFKDAKQLLGLGRYQNRSIKAVVTHLHLVCFAYALLTHIAITRKCEKEKKSNEANTSVRKLQDILRTITWKDTALHLKELPDGNSVFKELYRLLIAA